MARPPKNLLLFRSWLRDHRGSAPATVNSYCTLVRRVLREAGGEPDAESLYRAILTVPIDNRRVHRSAWNAFRAFALTQRITLPEIPKVKAAPHDVDAPAHLSDALLDACRRVSHSAPLSVLLLLTWGDVTDRDVTMRDVRTLDGTMQCLLARDPRDDAPNHAFIALPVETLDALRTYCGNVATDAPLLPRSPGDPRHYPAYAFKRALARC